MCGTGQGLELKSLPYLCQGSVPLHIALAGGGSGGADTESRGD